MNVGSVSNLGSSSGSSPLTQTVQRQPEAAEVKKVGRDKDGDADNGGAKAVQTPSPTVNMNGQKIGQIISVSA